MSRAVLSWLFSIYPGHCGLHQILMRLSLYRCTQSFVIRIRRRIELSAGVLLITLIKRTVDPLSITSDLMNELCSAKATNCENIVGSTAISAQASFEISPVQFNWVIDVTHKLDPPSIIYNQKNMWLQYTQSTALSSSVDVGPNSQSAPATHLS